MKTTVPLLLALLAMTTEAAEPTWMIDPAAARANRPALHREFPAVFAPVTDRPGLPRVLLIGDSISIGYTPFVRELLRDEANVHRVPDNGGATVLGIALMDEWLGEGKWDVIHFNFGAHDITLVDGHPRTPPAVYAANLRQIVARLQQTGAKLLFATTTPIPGETRNPSRRASDGEVVNREAIAVMQEAGVPINDLYALALPRLAELQIPANVHFREEGSRVLAAQVVGAIREALKK